WEATEEAFSQQLGEPVRRARPLDDERFLIAAALPRPDGGGVSVDLRPDTPTERGRRAPEARKQRNVAAVVGVAVALFAGASALYVQASNQASSRQTKANHLQTQAAGAEAQAAALAPYTQLASLRASRESAIRSIAGSRLDWATVLRDIARLTPSN